MFLIMWVVGGLFLLLSYFSADKEAKSVNLILSHIYLAATLLYLGLK